MDEIEIFWTKTAVRQRDSIFDYWNSRNKSKSYSNKLNLQIRSRITTIKENPEIGKMTDFLDSRVIFLGHYAIIYQLNLPKIIIIGFWDTRQDPEKLLELLTT
ncbi:type II toxin-antitoxin system RelE/ParE family toxin [Algoriphagus marinus]|uniref:type II toxin-antitoxin system RelE/ParE family toxin n=1 Tax=Algoriphagus marinus TaxID=1925762 RepID=UPI00094BAA5F|nr:type II toxin-antitoxin system RelE/ParE family toxin [Algoriphagus marinus]